MAEFFTLKGREMAAEYCSRCKTLHAFERHIYDAAIQRKGTRHQDGMSVYCPNGHSWHYIEGETEEDVLRRERDRLKQKLAQKEDEIDRHYKHRKLAERSASAYKGQVTRLKKRAAAGVCPCCKRQFKDLHRHMETKHPQYIETPDDGDNVVELKAVK